jgi:hypothetical protein
MEFGTSLWKWDGGVRGSPMRHCVAVDTVVTSDHLEHSLRGPRDAHARCREALEPSSSHPADEGDVRWIALAVRVSR